MSKSLLPNLIKFSRIGDDYEDDDDEPSSSMEIVEEDQISEVTSPSSEDGSYHTLSETSSIIEDNISDLNSVADSSLSTK